MSTDFEARLLGVDLGDLKETSQVNFASFNHNFANRQPVDFQLFEQMNVILLSKGVSSIPNFGGNIRTQGADTRYKKENGITGHFDTLTPSESYKLTSLLRAVVHFKAEDWGGGVFYYALNSHVPIITTQRYIDASNSGKFLVHNENCVVVNTPEEAAKAVCDILNNNSFALRLAKGMHRMKKNVFDRNYWERWSFFLSNIS